MPPLPEPISTQEVAVYDCAPSRVCVHRRVFDDQRAVRRMERVLAALRQPPPMEWVEDGELNVMAGQLGWPEDVGLRTGEIDPPEQPILVFNCFTWPSEEERAAFGRRFPNLRGQYFDGSGAWTLRQGRATLAANYGVCQDGYELHMAWGCLHRCSYCNIGGFVHIMLNVEEYVERLADFLPRHPECCLWKFDNHTDMPAFEPEHGASAALVDLFAKQRDQFLLLYTKSDNVDFLLPLDHGGKTLVSWTLSCETVARDVEKKSPPTAARLEAIRKCAAAGYPVRVRLSPVVPVREWRRENADMIGRLFANADVPLVTMDMFKHIGPNRAPAILDLDSLDPAFASSVQRFADMAPEDRPRPIVPNGKQLFPDKLREKVYRFFLGEIRRHSPRTRVALCGETPDMWRALADELGMTPERYVCACGPTSVPGHTDYEQPFEPEWPSG